MQFVKVAMNLMLLLKPVKSAGALCLPKLQYIMHDAP
jgi:hypothetical protein